MQDHTENADHSVKMFEAQVVDETLHYHVSRTPSIGDEQLECVISEDGTVPIDGVDSHLGG